MAYRIVLLVTFLALSGRCAEAQSPQMLRIQLLYGEVAPATSVPAAKAPADSVSAPVLYGSGLMGGAVGLLGGAVFGYGVVDLVIRGGPQGKIWVPIGGILGGLIGEGVGIPLGVHLANKRRGFIWPALLISPALAIAGPVLAFGRGDRISSVIVLGGTVAVQLIGSAALELHTSR